MGGEPAPSYLLSAVEETILGRESSCQIAVDSARYPTVSRQHAKVQPVEAEGAIQWQICDLGAANGTYRNGKRLQGCQILQSGDRIMLSKDGPEFIFERQSAVSNSVTNPSLIDLNSELSLTGNNTPIASEKPAFSVSQQKPASLLDSAQVLGENVVAEASPKVSPVHPSNIPVTVKLPDVTQFPKESAEAQTAQPARSIWSLATHDSKLVLTGHTDSIRAIAFSADGASLVSSSVDKTVRLWDLATAQETDAFSGFKLAVNAVAFHPHIPMLITGSTDKLIKLWDLTTHEELHTLTGHSMAVNAIAVSSDGKYLASGSADRTIKLWDLNSKEELRSLTGHKMPVNAVAFSPKGAVLASGSPDRTVKLWNCQTGDEIASWSSFRAAINALTFSPDGNLLAIGCDDKTVRLWAVEAEQEVFVFSYQSWLVGAAAISPDGQQFAGGSDEKTIKICQF